MRLAWLCIVSGSFGLRGLPGCGCCGDRGAQPRRAPGLVVELGAQLACPQPQRVCSRGDLPGELPCRRVLEVA